ncbi:MAG: class I SAM-dependent methyltransferase [Candidatus Odinarchaeota archaeon]
MDILRDPSDKKSKFTRKGNILESENGSVYPIIDGVPFLVFPKELIGSDKEFNEQYHQIAQMYDTYSKFLFEMVYEDEYTARSNLGKLLDVSEGSKVLEVSTGTGLNIEHVLKQIGEAGEVHALDLSVDMLSVAVSKYQGKKNVFFYVGNGSNLPFEDGTFDALLHVGGINTFADIPGAMQEFSRVVRKGGKIVISDEGMQYNLLKTDYGKKAIRFNGLYKEQPPLEHVPANARDLKISYAAGGIFYVLEFINGEEFTFNMDLQVPMTNQTLREHLTELERKHGN